MTNCKILILIHLPLKLSGFQFSVESNFAIALVLQFATLFDWLKKSLHFLNQSEVKTKPVVTRFSALGAGDMYFLRVLIGSLDCLRLL